MAEKSCLQTSEENNVTGRCGKMCGPCKKKNKTSVASVYCVQCAQYQCKTCESVHEMFDALASHRIVDADKAHDVKNEETKTIKEPLPDLQGIDKCEKHGKVFEFICVGHDALSCSACAIEVHRQCKEVNALSTQTQKINPVTDDLISELTEVRNRATVVINHVMDTKSSMHAQVDTISEEYDKMRDSVMQMFDALKVKIFKEAKDKKRRIGRDLERAQVECEMIVSRVDQSIAMMTNIKETGTPEQCLIVTKTLEKALRRDACDVAKHHGGRYVVNIGVKYHDVLSELMNIRTESLGSVELETKQIPAKLSLLTSIDIRKEEDDTEVPLMLGITFLPDGRLIAIDSPNGKLYLLNQNLETLGKYKFLHPVAGVVSIKESDVVVTTLDETGDSYEMYLLNVNKNNKITLKQKKVIEHAYLHLSLMDDKTLIGVIDDEENPVKTLDIDSGHDGIISGLPEEKYNLNQGVITFLSDRRMLVATNENSLDFYDVADNTCTPKVCLKDVVQSPCGVCSGPGDTVFVCTAKAQMVVQMNLSGYVVGSICTEDMGPALASLSRDGTKLAVLVVDDIDDITKMQIQLYLVE